MEPKKFAGKKEQEHTSVSLFSSLLFYKMHYERIEGEQVLITTSVNISIILRDIQAISSSLHITTGW